MVILYLKIEICEFYLVVLSMATVEPDMDLKSRILRTVNIIDRRGYNLSLERLSRDLIGGSVDLNELENAVRDIDGIEYDGTYVAMEKRSFANKCSRRTAEHPKHYKRVMAIAKKYSEQYTNLNPWVKCVMVTGSVASGGYCDNDDIDLNIVVHDGAKYTSYLMAMLLSLGYSYRYGKKFRERYIPGIPKVICINVVWEEHQVHPFKRQDGQVAYELLNSKVIFNSDFFRSTIDKNPWLNGWYPQIFTRHKESKRPEDETHTDDRNGIRSPGPLEFITKRALFSLFNIVRFARLKKQRARERMDFVENAKYPYGIFDEPGKTLMQ